MIIECRRHHLLERIRERGVTWSSVAPAIVSIDGDRLRVDVDHPAYPRRRVGPWPRRIRLVARLRTSADRGVGDTLERLAGGFGRAFKRMHRLIFGRACGCEARRDQLNRTYPYQEQPA